MEAFGNGNRVLGEVSFVTTTVVDWVDVFTRPKYKHIVIDSLAYCQKEKGLRIYAWVLMPNHLHAITSVSGEYPLATIMRDFKKFTSKRILAELECDIQESRRTWMLDRFRFAASRWKKMRKYQLWQDGYHSLLLDKYDTAMQKLRYIHDNPVRHEFVTHPEDWLYSSAIDYAGGKGLLNVDALLI